MNQHSVDLKYRRNVFNSLDRIREFGERAHFYNGLIKKRMRRLIVYQLAKLDAYGILIA
ncbi:MAG TPA: hypothetical protein VMS31_23090 [Pyrinomonadaceae bacterium]|nr:hypothetical protein [Pyrinomonadaceae bacterium]